MNFGSDCFINDWEAMMSILPSDAYSVQVWQDFSAEDRWIMHGCDGAGSQMMDCLGDVAYFEHLGGQGEPAYEDCMKDVHSQCSFQHPAWKSKDDPRSWFREYECGWWRAYDNPADASLVDFNQGCANPPAGAPIDDGNCYIKGRAVNDGGIAFGPACDDSTPYPQCDWYKMAIYAWRNCADCPQLGALYHTFAYNSDGQPCGASGMPECETQYKAWFAGSVFPWVCSEAGGDDTFPFTQESNKMCWCNNEPWNGRDEFAEPAWGSQIVYCVLDFDDQLLCDSIMLPYDAQDSWNADACGNSECGGYSQKVANFKMGRSNFFTL